MKIKKVRWKNFTSWGNSWNELSFDEDSRLSLICGYTGSGKSSIANVITYMLYGQIDGFTQKEIPNRVNKHFEGEIEFNTGKDDVFIKRGISPNYFNIYVNDEEIDIAGKNNVQKYLEDEIIKVPYQIFKNSIVLSVNAFKSFVNLTPKEKRDIIDRIFGYTIINAALTNAKSKLKELKTSLSEATSAVEGFDSSILSINEKINDIEKDNHTETIESYGKELNTVTEKLINLAKEYKDNQNSLKEHDSELKQYDNKLSLLANELYNIHEKISFYEQGICPICGTDLTDETHTEKHQELKGQSEELKERKNKLSDLKNKLSNEYEHKEQLKAQYTQDITNLKIKKTSTEAQLQSIKSKNEDLVSDMQKLVDDIELKKEPKKKEIQQLNNKINLMGMVADVFSDKGLKQFISNIYIPFINSSISEICERVGINYRIIFDEKYDCTIFYLGEAVSYSCLSTGERKKIDIAVVLAFSHIIKTKFTDINILFLDEVLSSIDVPSCNELLKIFNSFAKDNNLNMFIMHHAVLDSTFVDQIISVEKVNGFSHFV